MVEKFFLALDYKEPIDVIEKGMSALSYLTDKLNLKKELLGVKINQDLLTGKIAKGYSMFINNGFEIFADLKISHGHNTGRRIINRLHEQLPVDYVTVSAHLGTEMLKKYVMIGYEFNVGIIAWTIHTKTSPEDAKKMYKQPLNDAMFNLVQMASEARCDAAVMEAKMLQDERIRKLPIKKLVTGIRIDPSDKGTQKRVSTVEELKKLKQDVNYAVISSNYLDDFPKLEEILDALG